MGISDHNHNPPKRDICDCGVSYTQHVRCKGCTILLHTTEIYGEIGFSVDGLRCKHCVSLPIKKRVLRIKVVKPVNPKKLAKLVAKEEQKKAQLAEKDKNWDAIQEENRKQWFERRAARAQKFKTLYFSPTATPKEKSNYANYYHRLTGHDVRLSTANPSEEENDVTM